MAQPRVLIFDIETSPILVWTFYIGSKVSISHLNIKEGQKIDIICICYKWAGEKKIHTLDWGLNKQNSADMIEKFSKIIDQADVVISQNGDSFDLKHINTQRLLHNQDPILWPTSEDTLKMFRKYFKFLSNKQDYVASLLTGVGKDRMVLQDWIDVVQHKNSKAMKKMVRYCCSDVLGLSRVWNRIKKHCKPKAHRGLIMGEKVSSCENCGSTNVHKYGTRPVVLLRGLYQKYKCQACGHAWRGSKKLAELLA